MQFSGSRTNAKRKERRILFTQIILKNKNQKKVIYVMAAFLEAAVSSVF